MSTNSSGDLVVPEIIRNKAVSGIAVVGHLNSQQLGQVATWNLPVCLLNNTYDHPSFYSASLDDYVGCRDAVQYLAAIGRRHIAFVHGNIEWPGTYGRYRGYLTAMQELGLEVPPHWVIKVPDDQQNYKGGFLATQQILNDKTVDAILYVNDWYAIGGLCAAQLAGRSVPDDISVVGYDNSWMASQVHPSLTTLSLEHEELCRSAASMLVRAIEERPQIMVNCLIRPKLIVRDSARRRNNESQ